MRIVQPGQKTPYKPPSVTTPVASPTYSKVTESGESFRTERNTPYTPPKPVYTPGPVPIFGGQQEESVANRYAKPSPTTKPAPVVTQQPPVASYYGGVTPNPQSVQTWSQWGTKPPSNNKWGNNGINPTTGKPVGPSLWQKWFGDKEPNSTPAHPWSEWSSASQGAAAPPVSSPTVANIPEIHVTRGNQWVDKFPVGTMPTETAIAGTGTTPVGTTPVGTTTPELPQQSTDEMKYTVRMLAQKQANGINLTPEEYQVFVEAIMVSSGLSEPLELIDPSTNQTVQAYLDVGEVQRDVNGMQRGVRVNLVSKVLGQGVNTPAELTSIIYKQMGQNGLTVDEVQMLYPSPSAKDRSMGYNWENDSVIAPDGTQGNVTVSPFGTSQAPVFSGFYLAQNGLYYPINTAALAPQGYYSSQEYGDSGDRTGVALRPTTPIIAGMNTPNANYTGLGNLTQNLE